MPGHSPTRQVTTRKPQRPSSGISPEWKYPDAGTLKLELLRANPDGSWTTEDSVTLAHNGAYDGPDPMANNDTAESPDSGMYQLVNDILKPYMDQYAALYTVLDYGRRVQPKLLPGDSDYETADLSIKVDERRFSAGGCGEEASLYEKGTYQSKLEFRVDRYLIQVDAAGILTSSDSVVKDSPPQAFEKAVYLPAGARLADYQYTLIDPITTDEMYDYRFDVTVNPNTGQPAVNGLPETAYQVAALTDASPACQPAK